MNINMYELWEGLIFQITGSNLSKTISIGNIIFYRLPRSCNENTKNVIDEFTTTFSTLENNSNLIITGDYNINLLKIN